MKKLFLLLMSALVLTSCEMEDDGPNVEQVLAEVVETNLPETFKFGKIHEIKITYLLPDACHVGVGVRAYKGGIDQEKRRQIYIAGVASRPAGLTECDKESEELEREQSFYLEIDDHEPYTFYLWEGVDEEGENIYTQVVVPVGDVIPSTSAE